MIYATSLIKNPSSVLSINPRRQISGHSWVGDNTERRHIINCRKVSAESNDKQMEVADLRREIEHMPRDLGIFSLCMRSLYAGEAVGTNSVAAVKFRQLRDDTRNDAMVYFKGVFPICVKFVASISEFFEYYEELDYEEWCDRIDGILEETTSYKQLCETIVAMHNDILVPLRKRQDQARLIVRELKDLPMEYERKKRELEESASNKSDWAFGLSFVPYVKLIATPILLKEADDDLEKAAYYGVNAEMEEAAAHEVQRSLIPAIQSFIDGLHKAAGFFKTMELELVKFEGKAEKGLEYKKKLHYRMMKAEANKMDAACQRFYSIIPVVETDLRAIPTQGTDQNYVDRRLQRQIKMIEGKCTAGQYARKLVQAITGGQGASTRKAITRRSKWW